MEMLGDLLLGLKENIIIVAVSAVLPLLVGIALTFLARTHRIVACIIDWLSFPTECICPAAMLLLIYYLPGLVFHMPMKSRMLAVLIALPLCFLFHMPARYIAEWSVLKNILYNGLDLFSTLAKWSAIARLVAVPELLMMTERHISASFSQWSIVLAFVLFALLIGIFEIGKRLVKTFMPSKTPSAAE